MRAHLEVWADASVVAPAVRVRACKLHHRPCASGVHRGLQLLLSAVARAVKVEYPLYITAQKLDTTSSIAALQVGNAVSRRVLCLGSCGSDIALGSRPCWDGEMTIFAASQPEQATSGQ